MSLLYPAVIVDPFFNLAPDIASEDYGDLSVLKPGTLYDFVVKEHISERAGRHFDIRFGDERGLFSWASKKPFPEIPGEVIKIIRQPLHKYEYLDFEGELPPGYGHGPVKTYKRGKVLLTNIGKDVIDLTLDTGRGIIRYKFIKRGPSEKDWLLIVTTPHLEIPEKRKFKLVDEAVVQKLLDKLGRDIVAVQPKIDGAFSFIFVRPDGSIELLSPRLSKISGGPIFYTEKIFQGRPKTAIPRQFRNAVLVGEIYAVAKDKDGNERILPVNEISAILNSSLSRAINFLRENNIEFRVMLFDIYRTGKDAPVDPYSIPYNERKKLLEFYLKHFPNNFHAPLEVTTKQDAEKLLNAIKAREFSLTSEGVIIYPEIGVPYKFKTYQDADFYIVGFVPGKGKYANRGVGGIIISDRPDGKPIAVVGSGLTDLLREEMFQRPQDFLGRKVTIKFQEQTPNGSLRAPVFVQFAD